METIKRQTGCKRLVGQQPYACSVCASAVSVCGLRRYTSVICLCLYAFGVRISSTVRVIGLVLVCNWPGVEFELGRAGV